MGMVDNYVCAYEQELCRDMQTSCKSRCGMDAEKNTFERLDLLSLHSQGLQKPTFFFYSCSHKRHDKFFFSAYKKHIAHGKKHRVQNSFLNKRTMRVIIPAGPPRRILGAPAWWGTAWEECAEWLGAQWRRNQRMGRQCFFTSINNSLFVVNNSSIMFNIVISCYFMLFIHSNIFHLSFWVNGGRWNIATFQGTAWPESQCRHLSSRTGSIPLTDWWL